MGSYLTATDDHAAVQQIKSAIEAGQVAAAGIGPSVNTCRPDSSPFFFGGTIAPVTRPFPMPQFASANRSSRAAEG